MAKILLVDNSNETHSTLRAPLEDVGHEVLEPSDYNAVVRAVDTFSPDAIVMRVGSQSPDTFSQLRHLKMQPQTATLPVVVVSSESGSRGRGDALSLGAADFVSSPWGDGEIELRLDWILNSVSSVRRITEPVLTELTPVGAA